MTDFVRVVAGEYRNAPILNTVFPLVRGVQVGAKGRYVTVDATHMLGEARQIRVRINKLSDAVPATLDEYMAQGADAPVALPAAEAVQVPTETEEQAIERIRERFEILNEMSRAAIKGDIRAMIVSGPPGVGKSFGIEQEIEKATLLDMLASKRLRAEVIKGSASPIGLYQTLYKYSDPNCVVVFDDADQIFFDPVSLNLLKGALDSGKKRKISWLSESRVLRDEGIPDSFDFKGSVIFLTNISFSNVRSKTLKDHLAALESRCHFIDLKIESDRDKLLRIKQLIKDGMLDEYGFDETGKLDILEFLNKNQGQLREISLRTAIKAAELRKAFPLKWESFAKSSLLKSD